VRGELATDAGPDLALKRVATARQQAARLRRRSLTQDAIDRGSADLELLGDLRGTKPVVGSLPMDPKRCWECDQLTTRERIRFDSNYAGCSSARANTSCDLDAGRDCCAFAPSWRKPRAWGILQLLKQAQHLWQVQHPPALWSHLGRPVWCRVALP
jgi:hypothetical protein